MFHDLNDLIIMFLEKESTDNKGSSDNKSSNNKGTKRIYINDSKTLNKKTRRNLFKDNN